MISSTESPAAIYPRIVETVIRVPLITAFPLQTSGFTSIRSNIGVILRRKLSNGNAFH